MLARSVALVCGPSCAGKSTFVAHHAQPGDLVVDFDTLARLSGSTRAMYHAQPYMNAAEARLTALVAEIGRREDVTAWVIRRAPELAARQQLAQQLRATRTVVLLPTPALAKARARRRDTNHYRTRLAIDGWFRRYEPGDAEVIPVN